MPFNNEMDFGSVDILSIETGDNIIGRIKITDGTDVADVLDLTNSNPLTVAIVDSSGDQITSFGGGTQYAVDAALGATPTGTLAIAIRDDALSALTPIEGDAIGLRVDANGALWVIPSGTVTVDLGANNDVTVTGTVDLGATDNAVLDAIAASVAAIDVDTTTIIGHVDGIETLLGTIDSDTSGILTAVQLIDNAVSGSGFNISQLGGAAVPIGAGLEATALRVTLATDSTGVISIDDNGGAITVDGSVAVTNAGTFVTQENGAALTALQLIDDVVYVDDTATHATGTSKGIGIMAVATPTDTSINANDIGMIAMSVDRRQLVDANMQQGDADVAAGNPLQVSLANHAANATAVKVNIASGGIASGGIASGAIASGAIAAGAIAAGNTSIATTEDTARAAGEHLVKVGLSRLDTPVANANVSTDGDYTNFIADNFGKLWVAGTVPEDTAHVAGEAIVAMGARRIDTPATSAEASADWATVNETAEGALWITNTPTTTGGTTIFRTLDLDESEEEVKATAGNLYGYYYYNAATSVRYLKFYNATAANVTVGTTTPVMTLPLPASTAAHISIDPPIGFSTAITVAATTGLADNDTGAPGANEVILNLEYK